MTPKYGQKIEGEQAEKFRKTRNQIGQAVPPENKDSFVIRAANGVTDFIGARGIVRQFGNSIAEAGFRLQGKDEEANLVFQQRPQTKEVIGSALQTGAMLTPGGVGRSVLTKVALGATAGQMIDTGSDLQEGKSITDSLKPGVEAAIGASLPLAGEIYKGFGKLVEKTGSKIQFSTIKPNASDIKDGFDVATVNKYKLGGTLKQSFDKTSSLLDDLSRQLDDKLSSATETVDMNSVYQKTVQDLTDDKLTNFGINSQLGKAIDDLGDELYRAVDGNQGVLVKDANRIKRAAGHLGAWQYGVRDAEASARERVYNVFYTNLKNAIEDASPEGVNTLNAQMSEIIPVMNALIRRIPVAERNNLIGLGEIISLSQIGVNPSAGFLSLATLAGKSSAFGDVLQTAGSSVAQTETAGLISASKGINQSLNEPTN